MQPTVERQVRDRLERHQVRLTTGRRRVVAALAAAEGPRSAAELLTELDHQVPLSSVYRSLAVLEQAGVLTPHLGARGVTRYELAEWLSGHHHHLVCVDCGSVEDIRLSAEAEASLVDLVGSVAAGAGFSPTAHALDIEGRCGRCA